MYQPANERNQPKNTATGYLQTTKNTVTAYLQRKESARPRVQPSP